MIENLDFGPRLFLSEHLHRVDAGRPPCRQDTREQADGSEKGGRSEKGNRVQRIDLEEKPLDHSGADDGNGDPEEH